jgi:hypothetical protein
MIPSLSKAFSDEQKARILLHTIIKILSSLDAIKLGERQVKTASVE